MNFFDISDPELDDTRKMFLELAKDSRTTKIDLGIGIYRNEDGLAPVFKAIKKAEKVLFNSETSKSYKTPSGNALYCENILNLVLGTNILETRQGKIGAIQIPGAGSGLRIAGELIKKYTKNKLISVPEPTWGQQPFMFQKAGLTINHHIYYNKINNHLDFEGMVKDLCNLNSGDAVLIHGCCHNPTGADLSVNQWEDIANICCKLGLLPFIDLVYQGLGKGIEQDVAGIRKLVEIVPEVILTVSSSKTFGVYRDRCGLMAVITDAERVKGSSLETMLSEIARELYFHPPDHAASVINILLEDPHLKLEWILELETMQKRIVSLRNQLSNSLQEKQQTDFFSFLNIQNGMFSLLPISNEGIMSLRRESGIYLMPDGRVNIASIPESKIDYISTMITKLTEFN